MDKNELSFFNTRKPVDLMLVLIGVFLVQGYLQTSDSTSEIQLNSIRKSRPGFAFIGFHMCGSILN